MLIKMMGIEVVMIPNLDKYVIVEDIMVVIETWCDVARRLVI